MELCTIVTINSVVCEIDIKEALGIKGAWKWLRTFSTLVKLLIITFVSNL